MDWKDYIIFDKEILLGKPAIKGTRISVEHIVGLFAQGWNEAQILENYPRLTKRVNAGYIHLHTGMYS